MNKETYISQVTSYLNGGSNTVERNSKYHPEDVSLAISMAHNTMISQLFMQMNKRGSDGSLLDNLTKNYKVDVLDDDYGNKYIELPVSQVQIPNNAAIRFLGPTLDPKTRYVYLDQSSVPVWDELEASKLIERTYTIQGDRIVLIDYDSGVKQLLLRMVTPFEFLEDEDEVYILAGQENVILNQVREILSNIQNVPVQSNNDSTSKTV